MQNKLAIEAQVSRDMLEDTEASVIKEFGADSSRVFQAIGQLLVPCDFVLKKPTSEAVQLTAELVRKYDSQHDSDSSTASPAKRARTA